MNSEAQRKLVQRAGRLKALTQHPSWQEWCDETERRAERDKQALLADLLASGKPADQRRIDYLRGFWAGMHYAVTVPVKAEATLERVLRQIEAEGES